MSLSPPASRIAMLTSLLLALLPLAAPAPSSGEISQEELDALVIEIQGQVEEMRGLEYKRPVTASIIDRAGFLEYARQEVEEDSTPEELAADEATAKLLGYIPPEMDLIETTLKLLEEQVGGFYDPSTEHFCLMASLSGGLARITLAHELTHALDDQYHDLDGTIDSLSSNYDERFAYQAVVEGCATALMNQWTIEHLGELSAAELLEGGDLGMESLRKAPPYLWKPLLAVYLRGAAFLNRTESVMRGQMRFPSIEDLEGAFTNPPLSSEQVLHPEKYWDAEQRDDPVVIELLPDHLPEGWTVLQENTLGEIGMALLVEPLKRRKGPRGQLAIIGARYTYPAAEGWGGDRYLLLGRGEALLLLSLSAWDTAKDVAEFIAGVEKMADHLLTSNSDHAVASGVEGSGYSIERDETTKLVRLCSWIGATEEEIAAVIRGVETAVGH
jgi:hypothetical protein